MIDSIRELLIRQARMRVVAPVNYDTIMQQIGLDHSIPRDRDQLSEELAEISRFEHSKKRPMLSSMVMYAGLVRFGGGFYRLAEELGYGIEKELERQDFGREMQKRCNEFWINDDNYRRFFSDTSDEIVPDFFSLRELDYFQKWADKVYDKDDPKHVTAKNELMDTVWAKTVYWSDELVKRLNGYETLNPRMWSERGWGGSSGTKERVSRFKNYTWARIFKSKDRGRDIFFTVGVQPQSRSLLYKIDFYGTKESKLSPSQKKLCQEFIPKRGLNPIEVPVTSLPEYDWARLLNETETFIFKNEVLYDEIIESVWTGKINVSTLTNQLIRRETPKEGIDKVPADIFSFKGYDTNWEEQHRENANTGELGEELVIEYEKKCLMESGFSKDVKKAKDGEGYDVFSRNEDGTAKYIEVKSTTGDADTPFTISNNEIEFSKLNRKFYHLYRLFNLNKGKKVAEFHDHPGDVTDLFLLKGIQFNAYRKSKQS